MSEINQQWRVRAEGQCDDGTKIAALMWISLELFPELRKTTGGDLYSWMISQFRYTFNELALSRDMKFQQIKSIIGQRGFYKRIFNKEYGLYESVWCVLEQVNLPMVKCNADLH